MLLALASAAVVHAETIAATAGTWSFAGGCGGSANGTGFASQAEACLAASSSFNTCGYTTTNYGPNQYSASITAGQCKSTCNWGSVCGGTFNVATQQGYSCPPGQNWTLSGARCTRPDCVAPNVRNPATGVCGSDACTSKASLGAAQWFNIGTNPDSYPRVVCAGGCLAVYSGDSPAKSSLVNGVRNYFMYGGYDYTGSGSVDVCTANANTPVMPSGAAQVPVAHCASNQIEGLINGKLNCWNVPETPGAPPIKATVDAAPVTKDTTTTNVSTSGATTTTTTTTVNNSTGVTTIQTQACTAGNCTTTTQELGDATAKKPGDSTTPGTAAVTTGLYTGDTSGKTFSGVLTSFKNTVSASPVALAAGGFFTAGTFNGSCSALSVSFTMLGRPYALDATEALCGATAQTYYGYLAIGLLLIATVAAFVIAIL